MEQADLMLDKIARIAGKHLRVHPERCALVRNRNSHCRECALACTSNALSLVNGVIEIDVDNCIGCGTCSTNCPTGALEPLAPNDNELIRQMNNFLQHSEDVLCFACTPLFESTQLRGNDAIEIRCLGRVDECLIVDAASLGAKKILLVQGNCDICPQKPGQKTAQKVAESANNLLSAWGQQHRVFVAGKSDAELLGARFHNAVTEDTREQGDATSFHSQRDFYTKPPELAKTDSGEIAATNDGIDDTNNNSPSLHFAKVGPDGTLPHFVPGRRARLLDGLSAFGEPCLSEVCTRLWGHVRIDIDACISCRMCATFCPTGAIYKFDESADYFGVEHRSSDCVQCKICENICPARAIEVDSAVSVVNFIEERVERFPMHAIAGPGGKPNSILLAMKDLIGSDILVRD